MADNRAQKLHDSPEHRTGFTRMPVIRGQDGIRNQFLACRAQAIQNSIPASVSAQPRPVWNTAMKTSGASPEERSQIPPLIMNTIMLCKTSYRKHRKPPWTTMDEAM